MTAEGVDSYAEIKAADRYRYTKYLSCRNL